mmetsp:Transcript_11587/g.38212  ORF Transcript_11587/g.38212 Transcript_11587/m.38212 type:complete len:293 (+) Transcript_11587:838-1716(+)
MYLLPGQSSAFGTSSGRTSRTLCGDVLKSRPGGPSNTSRPSGACSSPTRASATSSSSQSSDTPPSAGKRCRPSGSSRRLWLRHSLRWLGSTGMEPVTSSPCPWKPKPPPHGRVRTPPPVQRGSSTAKPPGRRAAWAAAAWRMRHSKGCSFLCASRGGPATSAPSTHQSTRPVRRALGLPFSRGGRWCPPQKSGPTRGARPASGISSRSKIVPGAWRRATRWNTCRSPCSASLWDRPSPTWTRPASAPCAACCRAPSHKTSAGSTWPPTGTTTPASSFSKRYSARCGSGRASL